MKTVRGRDFPRIRKAVRPPPMKAVYLENFDSVFSFSETPLALTISNLGFAESWATPEIMQVHMTFHTH
jgi:hypothetical protein